MEYRYHEKQIKEVITHYRGMQNSLINLKWTLTSQQIISNTLSPKYNFVVKGLLQQPAQDRIQVTTHVWCAITFKLFNFC